MVRDRGAREYVILVGIVRPHLVLRVLAARLCLCDRFQVALDRMHCLLARLVALDDNSDGYDDKD